MMRGSWTPQSPSDTKKGSTGDGSGSAGQNYFGSSKLFWELGLESKLRADGLVISEGLGSPWRSRLVLVLGCLSGNNSGGKEDITPSMRISVYGRLRFSFAGFGSVWRVY